LLWDSVRTLTRLVQDLHDKLPNGVQGFTNRTRSARRRMQQIQRMTVPQRQQQQESKYRELLRITGQVVQGARQVIEQTKSLGGIDAVASLVIDQLRREITSYCDLADRVIDQTRRRVLLGEQVPSEQKVYSIFEPHTDLIKRGKVLKPVEFGHKVFLAESAQGLITDYRVLKGNPADSDQVEASLERHQQTFQHPPEWYAGDRGFYSADNVQRCRDAEVGEVCIPQRGGKKTAGQEALERSKAFKKAQRFRVGIEGRISVLFRGRGMKRCRAKGRERFEILVGAAVLANNLMRIAQMIEDQKPKRRRVAA
jgi:IS5 family transposase